MTADDWVTFGAIFILVGLLLITKVIERRKVRVEVLKSGAFELYVRTGTKTEAFHLLSRSDAKAAARLHLALVRERERQSTEFQSESSCPACTGLAVHWVWKLSAINPTYKVARECRYCGHTWKQK